MLQRTKSLLQESHRECRDGKGPVSGMLLSHRLALKVRATVTFEGVPRQTVSPHPQPPRMCARGPWLPSSLLPPSASAFPGPQRTVLLCVLHPLPPGHPPSPDSAPDAAIAEPPAQQAPAGEEGRLPLQSPGTGGREGPPDAHLRVEDKLLLLILHLLCHMNFPSKI